MVRYVPFVLTATLLAGSALAQEKRPASAAAERGRRPAPAGIRGVWKVTEQSSRAHGGEWTNITPHTSLYIFTEKHYSYMFTIGPGPRRHFAGDPNRPSEAEKVGAYDSFVAASGTYVLLGSTLTLNAALHKNPNEMGGEPLTYTVEVDGDTLRMTISNPPFSPGRERRTVLKRVE